MEHQEYTPRSHDSQDYDEFTPSHPYAGTSGFVDVPTSRESAYDDVASGVTNKTQRLVMILAAQAGARGITIAEVREAKGALHHGKMSSALTSLHAEGRLAALRARRNKCGIYVLPEFVGEQEVRPFKHNRKTVDPEVIRGVLLGHRSGYGVVGVHTLCECGWNASQAEPSHIMHQAEKIAEALNS